MRAGQALGRSPAQDDAVSGAARQDRRGMSRNPPRMRAPLGNLSHHPTAFTGKTFLLLPSLKLCHLKLVFCPTSTHLH